MTEAQTLFGGDTPPPAAATTEAAPETAADDGIKISHNPTTDQTIATFSNEDSNASEEKEKTAWYIDKETVGEGDRPDWLKEKYPNVFEQAKAYGELEKIKNTPSVPDKYELKGLPEDHKFDLESDDMKAYLAIQKDAKLSDEQVVTQLKFLNEFLGKNSPEAHIDAQIEKLGGQKQYESTRDTFNNTIRNMLSKEDSEPFLKSIGNADTMLGLLKILEKTGETPVAASKAAAPTPTMTSDEYIEHIRLNHAEEYDTKPAFKRKCQAEMERLFYLENGQT